MAMNGPVRPQEELFPWEEPEEPAKPKRVSASPATAPARPSVELTDPADEPDFDIDEADILDTDASASRTDRAVSIPVDAADVSSAPAAVEAEDGDDISDFAGAAALIERLEREAGLAPIETRERPAVAPKEYYAISEVCDLVGLKPHVLRYWETQFPLLNPSKNRSGNRVYQRKEIKLILLVKHLLYEEKYTIEGAKAQMDRMRRSGELADRTANALGAETLGLVRAELELLYRLLTPREPV